MKNLTGRQNHNTHAGTHMKRRQKGFTLMELMIVIAIVGVLSSIAVPSYLQSVRKSNRKAAATCLIEQAQYAERVYTTTMSYATIVAPTTGCAAELNSRYNFTVAKTANTYTFSAVAKSDQLQDTDCLNLAITQTGEKTVSGANSANPNKCWSK
jgi:type IV pilus assembly protein PilE